VQNDSDGAVSGEAQGSEDALKKFLQIIKTGPPLAEVEDLRQSDIDATSDEKTFEQRR